jgi:hypothetical protein
MTMDHPRKFDPRLIWGAAAAVLAAVALWAGTALAADGSSSSSDSSSTGNAPAQAAPNGGSDEAPRGDCPEGGPEGGPQGGPDGSGSYGGGNPGESFSPGV